jgi:hypothetical protein
MKHIHVNARRWFQRSAGNTYHTVAVTMPDGRTLVSGRVYGYGQQYEETAFELAFGREHPRHENGNPIPLWQWYQEHGYKVTYDVCDVDTRKQLHAA